MITKPILFGGIVDLFQLTIRFVSFAAILAALLLSASTSVAETVCSAFPQRFSILEGSTDFQTLERLRTQLRKIQVAVRAKRAAEYQHFLSGQSLKETQNWAAFFAIGQTVPLENGQLYKMLEFLGKGFEGFVYRVQGEDSTIHSLKRFYKAADAQDHQHRLEVNARSPDQNHVVSLSFHHPNSELLLTEYHDGLTFDDVREHEDLLESEDLHLVMDALYEHRLRNHLRRAHASSNVLIRISDLSLIIIDPK